MIYKDHFKNQVFKDDFYKTVIKAITGDEPIHHHHNKEARKYSTQPKQMLPTTNTQFNQTYNIYI